MNEYLESFMLAWIPLFVAMDPVGLIPLFLGMTRDIPPNRERVVVRQAVLTAGVVAIGFMFLGNYTLHAVGVTLGDFQVAGGLVLFVVAGRELVSNGAPPPPPEDFGVVPLGMPLITGPATLAALLVLVQTHGYACTLAALVCNLILVFLALRFGNAIRRWTGLVGLKAVSKIIALLLAAIAAHMVRKGWNAT